MPCRGEERLRSFAHVRFIGYLVRALKKLLQSEKLVDAEIEDLVCLMGREANGGFVEEGGLFTQGLELPLVRDRMISKLGLQT